MSIKALALDLERTLIDDALGARPRPGLFDFLAYCLERFERVVLFTSVETADAWEVLEGLAIAGYVPSEFLDRLEVIEWGGEYKDLAYISDAAPGEVLLVADDAGWVRPDQREWWVPISAWDGGADLELRRVRTVLDGWLARHDG